MSLRTFTAATALALAGITAAVAATSSTTTTTSTTTTQTPGKRHWSPPPSAERYAFENILVEKLSQQTGRSTAEIQGLMANGPRGVGKQLGLDEAAMRATFDSARQTLIQRMTDASLITAAQAEELKNAPPHRGRHGFGGHRPPRPDADAGTSAN